MPDQAEGTPIGKVFGTPVTIRVWEMLPLVEGMIFGALYWLFGRGQPGRSARRKAQLAALATPLVAGVEWCHNLAHIAAAQAVGKPADEFRLMYGTPRLRYAELNDTSITPRQHITRALGGPLFNLVMLPLFSFLRSLTPPESKRSAVINSVWWMNLLILVGGVMPIPGLDGGAMLKWALVDRGKSVAQADESVRKVNGGLAAGLGVSALLAWKSGKGIFALPLGFLAVIAMAIYKGWVREK